MGGAFIAKERLCFGDERGQGVPRLFVQFALGQIENRLRYVREVVPPLLQKLLRITERSLGYKLSH